MNDGKGSSCRVDFFFVSLVARISLRFRKRCVFVSVRELGGMINEESYVIL